MRPDAVTCAGHDSQSPRYGLRVLVRIAVGHPARVPLFTPPKKPMILRLNGKITRSEEKSFPFGGVSPGRFLGPTSGRKTGISRQNPLTAFPENHVGFFK